MLHFLLLPVFIILIIDLIFNKVQDELLFIESEFLITGVRNHQGNIKGISLHYLFNSGNNAITVAAEINSVAQKQNTMRLRRAQK